MDRTTQTDCCSSARVELTQTDAGTGVVTEKKVGVKWRAGWLLGISLTLILLGDLGASLIQTDFGKVQISGFKLPTENGQWITADLLRPTTASAEHSVPLVVVCPGFERSKETMGSYTIELARRGMAVIVIDPYGQGASSSTMEKRSASLEGYGVIPMVEHVWDSPSFDYVDKSRIGLAGYSAGGNAVLQAAAHFGAERAKALRHHGDAAEIENKISAVFIGGYVLTLSQNVLNKVSADAGLDYARYDEGAFRTENGTADLRTAPEALRLVNSIYPEDEQISQVDIGKTYGSVTNHTLRVVYNTKSIHPLMPYDNAHVANVIDFFTTAFGLDPVIPAGGQIWTLKEFFTLLALVGALLLLVPLAGVLLALPMLRSLAQPVPPALPRPGKTGKMVFWIAFAVSAAAACFLFIPLVRATATIFPEASASVPTWLFPERINNAILLWAVANGLIGLALFAINYQLFGKNNGVRPAMWGLKVTLRDFAKTIGLAFGLFAIFYGILFISYGIFHVDFRFTFVSAAAAFPPKILLIFAEYLPLFFIFYFANALRVNGANRFEGQPEWLGMLISALGNSVGLLMILAIQYIHLAASGRVFWTQEWLYTNLLLGVTPMMFVLPYFNRYFFRLTGRNYLGPLVTCLIFVSMMLTGNVCYLPVK